MLFIWLPWCKISPKVNKLYSIERIYVPQVSINCLACSKGVKYKYNKQAMCLRFMSYVYMLLKAAVPKLGRKQMGLERPKISNEAVEY